MTDIYTRAAATTARLLAPTSEGGLGQGEIVLVRYTAGSAPANEWDAPTTPTRVEIALSGEAHSAFGTKLAGSPLGDETIVRISDKTATFAPFGSDLLVGETVEIDGVPYTVMAVKRIPEAGTLSGWQAILRG